MAGDEDLRHAEAVEGVADGGFGVEPEFGAVLHHLEGGVQGEAAGGVAFADGYFFGEAVHGEEDFDGVGLGGERAAG